MNRTLELLLRGAKTTGSFTEGLNYIYEDLYVDEDIMHLQSFCNWLDTEIGGAGPANIEDLYFCFGNQEIPMCQKIIKSHKEKIAMCKC
tara:strand:+ start:111 stop:377 length:267 start_codon:yes stop_codon:yes gene_type:complete